MNAYINTTGIVLRETAYKDSSKILTVLTEAEGKLTVSARGALRKNSRLAAASQLLVFSEMTLVQSRGRWAMTEARSVEQFSGLRDDIALLALGSYFAELTEAVADEDAPNPELLPLCLNALYALSEAIKPPKLIKPVFELRLMAAAGLAPLLSRCSVCEKEEPEDVRLDTIGGTISCAIHAGADSDKLSRSALQAARYAIDCEPKKLFSFTLGETAMSEIGTAAERYVLTHLDRSFRTLNYYKKLSIV